MRRHGEEVLREAVVNLARDARAFLGDGAPELSRADRAPDADEQHAVGQQPQEVALRDEGRPGKRREDEVDRREEHQRQTERQPAVQVLVARAEAVAEADHADEVDEGHQRERGREQVRHVPTLRRLQFRQAEAECARGSPDQEEHEGHPDEQVDECGAAVFDAAANEWRDRDQRPAEEDPDEPSPRLRPVLRQSGHRGTDRERAPRE